MVCGEPTVPGTMLPPASGTPLPQLLHVLTGAHGWHPGALHGRMAAGAATRGGIAPLGVKPGGR